ncbi:hypothetical protein ScalyP_jg10862 [Parmales sp. scaly parma]|nr:hypothetical protein ScalyP_jg10862 [Parmales sp. scaly parma]
MPAHPVTIGGVTRRLHRSDPAEWLSSTPLIPHLSIPQQEAKSTQQMYSNWGMISASSLNKSNNPVGETSALRTSQVESTALNDTANYYAGSFNLAPGPASYDIDIANGLGVALSRRRGQGSNYVGTMGTSARACMLPSASHTLPDRPTVSPRPGPGYYVRNDSAIYGRNSTFDGMFRSNPAKADLDEKITRLQTINSDLARIKDKLANIDKLKPEEAKILAVSGKHLVRKLSKQKGIILEQIKEEKQKMKKVIDHPGPNGKAKKLLFDKNHPKSVPMNNKCNRFYDPVVSTATYLKVPGPGNNDTRKHNAIFGNSSLGVALRNKGVSWGNEYRPTDTNAPDHKSVAVVKLNKNGYAYYSDLNPNAGNNYQPSSIPASKQYKKKIGIGKVRVRRTEE